MKKTKIIIAIMLITMMLPIMVEAKDDPVIRLTISNYDPMPVQPGQFADVWLTVQNVGMAEAKNLEIKFKESPYFELVNPSDKTKTISVLGSYKDYVIKYRFKVADDVIEGINTLRFEHSMDGQPGVVSTSNINIDVKSTETPISVSSVKLRPDPVEAGQNAELMIAVTNPSTSSNLRDVNVELQLVTQEATGKEVLPFAPIDSTNKKSINRILPGQTTEFKFNLVTDPDAESKIYKVPVLFSYYDDTGNKYEDSSYVSINVNSEPDLYVLIESITIDKDKRSGEITFDVINQGLSNIKLLSFTLQETDELEITSSSNKEYLGNIDSDDFKSARFNINVVEEVEEINIPIQLSFRDALNNEYTETIEIKHVLKEPTEDCCNGYLNIIIIIAIIAIIGFFYYRNKQKKKKLMEEDND